MNRILPTVVAFFSSLINTLKEIISPFLQIDTRVLRLNGNGQNSKGSLKTFIISMVLLFTVSFANATDYYSKSTGNLNLTVNWGINTDGSGTSASILPPSACPSYTASIKTNGSVCNTAPPGSVSLKVTLVGGQSPYSVQFRNEITGAITMVTNYTSDTDIGIPVPAVTTPYTLVSVTDANACTATITQAYTSILLYSIPATPTANIVNVACSSDATGRITMNNAYQPGSLKFNGVNTNSGSTSPIDSHVDFGTPLLSNLTQFTGEGWIKFDKTKYKNRMSLFGQNDVVEFGFEVDYLRCWTANGGVVTYPLSSYPADNAWHHIAVVGNGTNLQFFIDGVSVVTGGSAITTNYGNNTNYTTKIGWGVMDVGGVGLVGEVFNLSFWNRALSSDEIVGLATGFTQYNSKQVGLLAGYSFNEGSGTTMSSVGSVAPTGTLKGATLPVWTDPSTYSWTSTPPGFTSSLKNLTGLSPKTYNLAINLKGCPKTTSFVVNATNVSPTISTSATPAIVTAVCRNNSIDQTTTMAYTATTGTPTSYSINWTTSGITDQVSTVFSFASGGGTVTGIIVPVNTSAKTYAGTMTIKTDNGCTATQSISLVVGSVTPATPTATPATNVGCSGFTANWNPVAGATGYYLDVSPDSNFGNYNIGGFQNQAVTGTSFGITGLTAGQTYYYRVRAYNSCGSKTSLSFSNTVNISVSVAVTNSILTQTICSGDSSAAFVLTSGVAGTTFDWTASAPSGIAGFTASATGTSGLPVQTITNTGTVPGTVTYSITPKANGCTGTAVNYTIVVNPTPKVSNTPLTQTICSGSSSTLVTLTSATAGASFTWTATATAGVTGFSTSGTNTIPALNISTSGTTQGTITYVITPTANGCPGTASNYTILVNPTPIVTNTSLTQTICSGGNTALVTLTSGVTGTTFAWTASATAGVAGFTTSGTGTIPAEAISTTGTTQGAVTYVITPTANGCPGTATNYTVLVNPLPTVTNTPLTQTICSGGNTALVTLTSGVASTTFAWTATATTGVTGFATSGTSTIPAQTISTTGTTQGTVTYVITPTAGGCPGAATNYTVLVNPNNTIVLSSAVGTDSQAVCVNSPIANITYATSGAIGATFANLPTGVSGSWAANVVTISGTPTVAGAALTYTVTLTGGCGSISATGTRTITVNPLPATPTASATTQPTCAVPTGTITVTAPITGNMYTVTGVSPLVYTATNGTGVFPGLAVGSYNVTTSNATCTSTATGPISINAQATKNWIGGAVAGITNWNVPGNWSPSGVPSATDCVTIPNVINKPIISGTNESFYANTLTVYTDSSLTVNGTNVLTVSEAVIVQGTGTLTFENNASLIQNNDAVVNTGVIVYNRTAQAMKNFDFTYWSSPVAGQTLVALSPDTLLDKYYSFENNAWKTELGGATTMDFGKGYIIRVPKPNFWPVPTDPTYAQPVQFKGKPNNGVQSLAIGTTNGDANLIGNPYPSAMSADAFLATNNKELDGTIYFWTHNTAIYNLAYSSSDYASYNGVGGTNTKGNFIDLNNNGIKDTGEAEQIANRLDGNIAAGQSFFTVTKRGVSPTGKVTFNNSMRVGVANKNAQFFKGSNSKATTVEKHRVWLNLTNTEGAFKQTLVGYVTGATQGNDSAFDGESFDGNPYIDFYSINDSKNLVIQGRALPFDKTDKVPLGYKTTVKGTFAISIDQVDGALENQTVFVEDKVANVIHNLKTGAYSFTTGKGVFNDRFVLRYMDNTPVVPEPEIKDPIVTDPGVKDPVVTNPIVPNPEVKDPIVLDPNTGSGTLGTDGFENKGRAVVVSVKNHQIKINSFEETIGTVMVYDLRGRLLYQNKHVNKNEFVIYNLNSNDQFLIVLTQLINGKWITKEIVF